MPDPGLTILVGALACGFLTWLVRPEKGLIGIALGAGVGGVLGALIYMLLLSVR